MKHLSLCIVVAISLLACNNNKKNAVPEPATPAEISEIKSESDKKMEELQQLTPRTLEEMKALLPIEIDGDSTENLNSRSYLGTNLAEAMYKQDTSWFEVRVYDLGGVAGAGVYKNAYLNSLNEQYSNNGIYRMTVDFKGGKAIEELNTNTNFGSLAYVDNRYFVQITGNNTGIDKVRDVAKGLKLK